MSASADGLFDLSGRVAIVTGGAGLLGCEHAAALAGVGAVPVLLDVDQARLRRQAAALGEATGAEIPVFETDITSEESLGEVLRSVIERWGRVDILINNAANNPKMEDSGRVAWSRLENFPVEQWNRDLGVGLTGAFLCSRVFGGQMASAGRGVIVNIASDLGVIAPDQRLYRVPGMPEDQQPVKPVTYSVVKTGLLGLTRYLATYWADRGVRVNALSPGGIQAGQPEVFVQRVSNLIPMSRMAQRSEYRGAILFLCSDASSYMTGQNLVVDGGRTCW